jgi:hypothetical protein
MSDFTARPSLQEEFKRWLKRRLPASSRVSVRRWLDRWNKPSTQQQILAQTGQVNDLFALWIYEQAKASPRFAEEGRLLAHGFSVYSQHDEDGIIEEIFRRIGETDRYFVEFGVGDGIENCTSYLVLKGWRGSWIDGSAVCCEGVRANYPNAIADGRLRLLNRFIDAENIEALFQEMQVPESFDFLSIDIDYNDYWVWNAIKRYSPRVVTVEYNASFRATVSCSVKYNPSGCWDGSNFYGASLKAFELLGREKGYTLVGCNYTGVNAFFVRNDLVGKLFAAPYTSENHYEPARYFVRMPNGHKPKVGEVFRPGNQS